ncbi:MAG TPA: hypothetical protein VG866_01845, partial [Candidatus Paceibacterota bacterium]|nr:hypothetical protein [Candidatus Paceibacterota bacterium]
GRFAAGDYTEFQKVISFFETVLGIIPSVSLDIPGGEKIDTLRAENRYEGSDKARQEYQAQGYIVENTKHGTLVMKSER